MKMALLLTLSVIVAVARPHLPTAIGQEKPISGSNSTPAEYSLISLGTLGGKSSFAVAINATGQIVGRSETTDGRKHAFLFNKGMMLDLGTLGGKNSEAYSINASGQIVGDSDLGAGSASRTHGFLYDHGKMQDLGTLGGESSRAIGINDSGLIVGMSDVFSQNPLDGAVGPHAFIYSGGKMRDLAGIVGAASSVNNSGQIAGSAMFNLEKGNNIDTIRRAAIFGKDAVQDLGLPPKKISFATAINASGQVAGTGNYNAPQAGGGHQFHAFLYDQGTSQDIGTLGGEESRAYAINSSGQVVGTADTASDSPHAFLFDGDRMLDLNGLASTAALASSGFKALTIALGINDRGQIVGEGKDAKGNGIAFLLTPMDANR
jgi:probable HAF family extracellular repeat protein